MRADARAGREGASFVAQYEALSKCLREDLEGITVAELEWQPAQGMNSIGMLLAHMAIVEVHWMNVGVLGLESGRVSETLGIPEKADGIPLAADAKPPAELAGKAFDWYQELERKAREYTHSTLKAVDDAGFDAEIERTFRDGKRIRHNVRWVVFHVLEHYAGHYGQILMLRHQYRDHG